MADEKNKAPESKEVKQTEQPAPSQEEARKAADAPVTQDENPKVIAPHRTVPSAMAAPGASPPHPTSTRIDQSQDTEEISEARGRIAEESIANLGDRTVALGEPKGDPIQCIAKKKFFSDRGELVRAGATFYYQEREGSVFPANVLEPVNKAVASRVRKEYDREMTARREDREQTERDRRRMREAMRV